LQVKKKTILRCLCSRRLKAEVGSILLAGLLAGLSAVIAGCAALGPALPEPPAAEPAPVLVPAPAPALTGPTVTPLPDGRLGFIINEIPNHPEDWQSDFNAAAACLDRQDYAGAVDLLLQVIDHEPGVSAPYINIALAYQELGKPEQAEENLKKALELFPAHPAAGNAYGLLLRRGGRFAEAQTVYQQVLERFPGYAPAHRNLGILCDLYLNDLECALGQYELYREANPEDKEVNIWLADLRQRLGH